MKRYNLKATRTTQFGSVFCEDMRSPDLSCLKRHISLILAFLGMCTTKCSENSLKATVRSPHTEEGGGLAQANNHLVRSLTALGVALLLYVVLLPGTGVAAKPGREKLRARELSYVVEPICEKENCRLLVGLTFQGDSSGESRLLLPLAWSEGVELYRAIRNIRSLSEDVKVEDTKEPHVKTVRHRPNQRVSLTSSVSNACTHSTALHRTIWKH